MERNQEVANKVVIIQQEHKWGKEWQRYTISLPVFSEMQGQSIFNDFVGREGHKPLENKLSRTMIFFRWQSRKLNITQGGCIKSSWPNVEGNVLSQESQWPTRGCILSGTSTAIFLLWQFSWSLCYRIQNPSLDLGLHAICHWLCGLFSNPLCWLKEISLNLLIQLTSLTGTWNKEWQKKMQTTFFGSSSSLSPTHSKLKQADWKTTFVDLYKIWALHIFAGKILFDNCLSVSFLFVD